MNVAELPTWWDYAECVDYPADWFFPSRGESPRPAKEICSRCTVRKECLAYAMDNFIKHGIWGGKSEKERRALRKQRVLNGEYPNTPPTIRNC